MTADPLGDALADTPAPRPTVLPRASIDVTPDGASVNNVVVTSPINRDWSAVFALFNLDADDFEVVDDTVRMSTWQQSKATDDGTRDAIQLYAYSARFRRVTAATVRQEVIDEWRAALKVRRPRTAPNVEPAGTYLILVADPQIGKKQTSEALDNWRRGVTMHLDAARKLGPAVSGIHVAFMGDEFEGVVNNYPNQPHTVEMNLARQIETAYDLEVWTIREALALRKPVTASAVISNHGEWTRNGGKDPITTHNDNGSTHLARQVKKLFRELEPHTGQRVEWTIGDTHPGITLSLSGVKCYFTHGYVERGRGTSTETRTRSAVERQILGRTEDLGDVKLYLAAHYHHCYFNEFEGRTLFGCPALEGERSSEYMLDGYGVWSPPGMLGMLVGQHSRRGWSDANVF